MSDPTESTITRLDGDNVVDLEVEIGKLDSIIVTKVSCGDEGARRWRCLD